MQLSVTNSHRPPVGEDRLLFEGYFSFSVIFLICIFRVFSKSFYLVGILFLCTGFGFLILCAYGRLGAYLFFPH